VKLILGERIKQLRKEKGWLQSDLGISINSDPRQISQYENNKITPSLETVIKLAQVFQVTTDYLLNEHAPRTTLPTQDVELLKHLDQLQNLTETDRSCLYHMIDALITKNEIRSFAEKIKKK